MEKFILVFLIFQFQLTMILTITLSPVHKQCFQASLHANSRPVHLCVECHVPDTSVLWAGSCCGPKRPPYISSTWCIQPLWQLHRYREVACFKDAHTLACDAALTSPHFLSAYFSDPCRCLASASCRPADVLTLSTGMLTTKEDQQETCSEFLLLLLHT